MEELREEQTNVDYILTKCQVLNLRHFASTLTHCQYTDEETESERLIS